MPGARTALSACFFIRLQLADKAVRAPGALCAACFSQGDQHGSTFGAIATDTWVHVAASFDGSAITFYVNGVADGTVAHSYTTALNSWGLVLGGTIPNDGYHLGFSGAVDDVYLYDRALSAAEVTDLMNGDLVPEPSTFALAALGGASLLLYRKRK